MVAVDQEEEEEGESLWVPCLQMEQLCWWSEMSARHIHHTYIFFVIYTVFVSIDIYMCMRAYL